MSNSTVEKKPKSEATLRFLGFCGADDSVDPKLLGLICHGYPFVEFGVLFRPDKEGEPRYASPEWVERLSSVAAAMSHNSKDKNAPSMRLAAHLCGARVNELLQGKFEFISTLPEKGFRRVQINATAVNGVDTSALATSVPHVASAIGKFPQLEFILQKNEETKPLWDGLLSHFLGSNNSQVEKTEEKLAKKPCIKRIPSNFTMLLDESKGTGILTKIFPSPPDEYEVGYAGGIGPANIISVLHAIEEVAKGRCFWIDMESSLRSEKDNKDIFDLDKCFACISAVCKEHYYSHPRYLEE